MSKGTCTSHFMDDICCQFPHPSLNPLPFCPHSEPPSLLTVLGNPPLMLVVQMFVHTRPWLVINCQPPTPNSPLLLLTVPYSPSYMFSKTTIQHQVHSLIQLKSLNPAEK